MKSLDQWLDEYSLDHQNSTNKKLHFICVPAIFCSVVAFLHLIPFELLSYPIGDWILLLSLFWYASLELKAFVLMFVQLILCLTIVISLQSAAPDFVFYIFLAVFVVAWIGQFWGHHLEGKRPSFFTDLKYLLIGPLWVWLGQH